MKIGTRPLGIEAGGKTIVVMDNETAEDLGIRSLDRIRISYGEKRIIAIVNVASNFPRNVLGVYDEVRLGLGVKEGEEVDIQPAEKPESMMFIRDKVDGHRLSGPGIRAIVLDVLEHHLGDVELASFITALDIRGLSMEEVEALTRAMVETGEVIKWDKEQVFDKHSIGGVPGDKTTLIVVPIIASAGLTIPKTSSRAVTSPAGTADRAEVLCPVDLTIEEIKEVVDKTNGCMVWGGALSLAPADDLFINIEYPLAIDPLLLASIMSKKKAIGSNNVLIDIPLGVGAKVKTIEESQELATDFIELGRRLSLHVECAITSGEQPIGYAVGPALEAREALQTLMGKGARDLKEKATNLAGIILEMAGIENGKNAATRLIKSGKAERKLREIISAQGGDPEVKPEDMRIGDKHERFSSDRRGRVTSISNTAIAQIAREAGAPKDKGAGVLLKVKLDDEISKGEGIFDIYAERNWKMEAAVALAESLKPIGVGRRVEGRMLIDRIPMKVTPKKPFVLER
jgi:AMP phosphorylase